MAPQDTSRTSSPNRAPRLSRSGDSPFGPSGAATWNDYQRRVRELFPDDLSDIVLQIESDFCAELQHVAAEIETGASDGLSRDMGAGALQKRNRRLEQLRDRDADLPAKVLDLWGRDLRLVRACLIDDFPELARRFRDVGATSDETAVIE